MFGRMRWFVLLVCVTTFVLAGCASQDLENENKMLRNQLAQADQVRQMELERLRQEKDAQLAQLQQQHGQQVDELAAAQTQLAKQLQEEIANYRAKLEMTERGLVVTFLSEVLFDSGKADIKPEGYQSLDKLAEVLQNQVLANSIAIEGHTDNEPIRYSGWKSNWELSTGRALGVLHYFVDQKGIDPKRLSVMGYGEYRPVASNETAGGRRQNRRVEIVIFPSKVSKVKGEI